jgi:hypothetical protein
MIASTSAGRGYLFMVGVQRSDQYSRGGKTVPPVLDRLFRQRVIEYINGRRLEDGGYFFARMPPSGGMDTYYAVAGLRLLGKTPSQPQGIVDFFLESLEEDSFADINGLFAAVETASALGLLPAELKAIVRRRVPQLQTETGGFGAADSLYVEVPSELQATCRAVSVLKKTGVTFDEARVMAFVHRLLNADGSYGVAGYSPLASTYYATEICRLLGEDIPGRTVAYLKSRETRPVQFLEDQFWLVGALANAGQYPAFPERAFDFVMACWRRSGGFSRATTIGISTLEYTYYALSVLKDIGALTARSDE